MTSYLPEFYASFFGRHGPSMTTVNLTNRCDQQCIYCEIGKNLPSEREGKLTIEDLYWIIGQMSENGIKRLSLCGGEPFLFDGILDVVACAGRKKITCTITTNGMTLYKLQETEIAVLKKYNAKINISIDSFDDSIQALTRGTKTALPNALKSIKILQEHDIPVTVLTAISKYNYHELFDFLTVAHKKGIKQVLFQPIIYYSNYPDRPAIEQKSQFNVGVDNLEILMEQLKSIHRFERNHLISTNVYRILPWIEAYLKTAADYNGKWFFDDVLNKFYCREIDAIIDISYDGGIQPCGLELATTTIHENRERGLMTNWKEATAALRDDLDHGRYHPVCNGCCHHFSRNMLASIMKYPYKNKGALLNMSLLLLSRIFFKMMKKIYTKR